MYDDPKSSNEGGVLKIYDEPQYTAIAKGGGEGACLRYMMNRNRQMRGHVSDT